MSGQRPPAARAPFVSACLLIALLAQLLVASQPVSSVEPPTATPSATRTRTAVADDAGPPAVVRAWGSIDVDDSRIAGYVRLHVAAAPGGGPAALFAASMPLYAMGFAPSGLDYVSIVGTEFEPVQIDGDRAVVTGRGRLILYGQEDVVHRGTVPFTAEVDLSGDGPSARVMIEIRDGDVYYRRGGILDPTVSSPDGFTQLLRPEEQARGARWRRIPDLPMGPHGGLAMAAPDGQIYMLGAACDKAPDRYGFGCRKLARYDTGAERMESLPNLGLHDAGWSGAAGPDGVLYFVRDAGALGHAAVAYRPETGAIAPLPTPPRRSAFTSAAVWSRHDARLYAYAWDGDATSSLQSYDPATASWRTTAPMAVPRFGVLLAAGPDGRIHAVGGMERVSDYRQWVPSRAVEVYDPGLGTWSRLADLPLARTGLQGGFGWDGRLYVLGGGYAHENRLEPDPFVLAVDVYDPAAGSWTRTADLPIASYGASVAVGTDGRIYAFGPQAGGRASFVLEPDGAATAPPAPWGPTATPTSTATSTASPTPTVTLTASPTLTATASVTLSGTPPASGAATLTATPTATVTASPTLTATSTPSATVTLSATTAATPTVTFASTPLPRTPPPRRLYGLANDQVAGLQLVEITVATDERRAVATFPDLAAPLGSGAYDAARDRYVVLARARDVSTAGGLTQAFAGSAVVTVDLPAGTVTRGPVVAGGPVGGVEVDPADGALYARRGTPGATALLRIDPATGAAEPVAAVACADVPEDASAFDSVGRRYLFACGADLAAVDVRDGAISRIAGVGALGGSLEHDPLDGALYALGRADGRPALLRIDLDAGAASTIAWLDGASRNLDAATFDPLGRVYLASLSADGELSVRFSDLDDQRSDPVVAVDVDSGRVRLWKADRAYLGLEFGSPLPPPPTVTPTHIPAADAPAPGGGFFFPPFFPPVAPAAPAAPTRTPTPTPSPTATPTPTATAPADLLLAPTVPTVLPEPLTALPPGLAAPPADRGAVHLIPPAPAGVADALGVVHSPPGAPAEVALGVPAPAAGAPAVGVRLALSESAPSAWRLAQATSVTEIAIDVFEPTTGVLVHHHSRPLRLAVRLSAAERAACSTAPTRLALLHVGADGHLTSLPRALDCAAGVLTADVAETSSLLVALLDPPVSPFRLLLPLAERA